LGGERRRVANRKETTQATSRSAGRKKSQHKGGDDRGEKTLGATKTEKKRKAAGIWLGEP